MSLLTERRSLKKARRYYKHPAPNGACVVISAHDFASINFAVRADRGSQALACSHLCGPHGSSPGPVLQW
jgi:hypothetical protein